MLAITKCRVIGMFPDPMGPCDHDGEERPGQAVGEYEGSTSEGDFDPEDGALGEDNQTLAPVKDAPGVAEKTAHAAVRGLGRHLQLARRLEKPAEMTPLEELISDQVAKSERETGEQKGIGETLMKWSDHVAPIGIDVFETADLHLEIEET
jgi:hypothetical protein